MITSGSDRVITLFSNLPRTYLYRVLSIDGAFAPLVNEDDDVFVVYHSLLPDGAKINSYFLLTEDGCFVPQPLDEADDLIRTTVREVASKVASMLELSEREAWQYVEDEIVCEQNRLFKGSL